MKNIAIFGATGVVGRNLIKILNQRRLTYFNFYLYAKTFHNEKVLLGGKSYSVNKFKSGELDSLKFDYAFLCTRDEASMALAPLLIKNGTIVIDESAYFRQDFPLVIPEINASDINGKLITSPNCSTTAGVMALYKIKEKFGLKGVVYTTFQAVSGAGKSGLDDLKVTTQEKLKTFPFVIRNNLIPCIGNLDDDGNSKEEKKMIFETKKILHAPDLKVSATCVRVPITVGHSMAINFETKKKADIEEIERLLRKSVGVKYIGEALPMPKDVRGKDYVIVGRLRKNEQSKKSFSMFATSDNLRKGASLNVVQIFEELLKRDNQ